MKFNKLTFLKLGGSLITDKDSPHTPRRDVLARLAQEIAAARAEHPQMPLLIGHGSGSYGHTAAHKYGTRQGVQGSQQWTGFVKVWKEARALNQLVVDYLLEAGLPVIAFPPSAAVTARGGQPYRWDTAPIQAALAAGLIPLIQGDVIFDETLNGTILSTEDLFIFLAGRLHPRRILLAGLQEGVWADFPQCTRLIPSIDPTNFEAISTQIGRSASVDVTGGMLQKVQSMVELVETEPELQVMIFSGGKPSAVQNALLGDSLGTVINKLHAM